MDAAPEVTFGVLVDPTTYPEWLVGAKRIRDLDGAWPAPGSAFHHSVGVGPLRIDDRTHVVACDAPHVLVLEAGIGPLGRARVRFTIGPDGRGGSHLAIEEEPAAGPLRLLWNPLTRPLVAASLWGRNALSLQALRRVVEERSRS
jgi:hypothetical protein